MQLRKVCASVLTVILFISSLPLQVFAVEEIVRVNGFLEQVYILDEDVLKSDFFGLMQALDLNYDYDRTNSIVSVTNGSNTVKIVAGESYATVNGVSELMPSNAVLYDERIFVPMFFVCDALGIKYEYDESIATIAFDTGNASYSMFNTISLGERDKIYLSYDEALELALKNNSNLKNLTDSIKYLEENRKNSYEGFETYIMGGYSTGYQAATYLVAVRSIDNALSNVDTNKKFIEDGTQLLIRQYVSGIKSYEMNIALLKASIELDKINIRNLELKESLGMESALNVRTAKFNHEQNLLSLQELEKELSNLRASLNIAIGMDSDTNVEITYDLRDMNFDLNLEEFITHTLRNDPSLKIKKQAVDEAQYAIDTFNRLSRLSINPATGEKIAEQSFVQLENDYNSAVRAYNDAKDAMENAIRTEYNNIKKLEESQRSLEIDLQKAIEDYDTAVLSYQTGNLTMYEVELAKLGILKAEIALISNTYSYTNSVFSIERPYLLVSSN